MARYESPIARNRAIVKLRKSGWTVRAIADEVGISSTAVQYVLKPRTAEQLERKTMCEGCGFDFRVSQLNRDGICGGCESYE